MKKLLYFFVLLFVPVVLHAQDNTTTTTTTTVTTSNLVDDYITQYDPYILNLSKYQFYADVTSPLTKDNKVLIVMTGDIGTTQNAFIRFITSDQLGFDGAGDFKDGYLHDVSYLTKKGILVPPVAAVSGDNFLVLNISSYEGLTDEDYAKVQSFASSDELPVATPVLMAFQGIYNNYPQNVDVLKPMDSRWAEAQAFMQGMNTRKKFDLGTVTFTIPNVTDMMKMDPSKLTSSGERKIENQQKYTTATISLRKLMDEPLVYNQPYYKSLYQEFLGSAGKSIYKDSYGEYYRRIGEFRDKGFVDKNDVYINPEAKRQLGYVLDLLYYTAPAQLDTTAKATGSVPVEVQQTLNYFRDNMSQKTRANAYIYDTYIANTQNRAMLDAQLGRLKRYYNLQ